LIWSMLMQWLFYLIWYHYLSTYILLSCRYGDMLALGHGEEKDELLPKRLNFSRTAVKNIAVTQVAGGGQHSAIIGKVVTAVWVDGCIYRGRRMMLCSMMVIIIHPVIVMMVKWCDVLIKVIVNLTLINLWFSSLW